MTDLHSHILFNLDDGSDSFQESKRMLHAARAAGIDRIIATPHVRHMPYEMELAMQRYADLAPIAEQKGIALGLGFEMHWNSLHALDETAYKDFCFRNTHTMLLEFSLSADELPQDHDQLIYRLQRAGIRLIIAHPERYRFVQSDKDVASRWKDMGCDLQLDANCLLHSYELKSKATARKLFKAGMYDFLASDAHCAADYETFNQALNWADKHA